MIKKLLSSYYFSAALVVTGMAIGWYLGKNSSYQTEVANTQTVTETKTTTRRTPDGVVVIDKTEKRVETKDEKRHVPAVVSKNDYSIGVSVRPRNLTERPEILVTGGRRLLGDLWVEVGTSEKLNEVRIGVRWDF